MRNILALAVIVSLSISCLLDTTGKGPEDPDPIDVEEVGGSSGFENSDGSIPDCFEVYYVDVILPDGSVVRYEMPPLYCFPPRLPDRDPPTYAIDNPISDPVNIPLPQ